MTSSLDRLTADGSIQSQPPATTAYAAGTLPSCGRHAVKLLKLNLICIINCTTSKKRTKNWTTDLNEIILNLRKRVLLERGQLGSYWLELAILTLVAVIAFVTYFLASDGKPALC